MIAELDLVPFQLSLEQAQLQKEHADRTLERYEKLSGETVSQVSIDDAKTQAELAGVAVRNAEYSLQHATLTAPFDALVAVRNVANFTTISAGTSVVRLPQDSEPNLLDQIVFSSSAGRYIPMEQVLDGLDYEAQDTLVHRRNCHSLYQSIAARGCGRGDDHFGDDPAAERCFLCLDGDHHHGRLGFCFGSDADCGAGYLCGVLFR